MQYEEDKYEPLYQQTDYTKKTKTRKIKTEILIGQMGMRETRYLNEEQFKQFQEDEVKFTGKYWGIHPTMLEFWLMTPSWVQCNGFKKNNERCRNTVRAVQYLEEYFIGGLCKIHKDQSLIWNKEAGWIPKDKKLRATIRLPKRTIRGGSESVIRADGVVYAKICLHLKGSPNPALQG
jgi:hypothetical protein